MPKFAVKIGDFRYASEGLGFCEVKDLVNTSRSLNNYKIKKIQIFRVVL